MRPMCEPLEGRQLLASNGLSATYFNNNNFTGHAISRNDPSVNYDWPNHQNPAAGITGTTFSVRWTGLVKPRFSETYTFIVRNNDGVRLWINGCELINSWTMQPRTTHRGAITLKANRQYDIRLEYFDHTRTAAIALSWQSKSTPLAPIPRMR